MAPGEEASGVVEPSELQAMYERGVRAYGLTLRGAVVQSSPGRHHRTLHLTLRDSDYERMALIDVQVKMPGAPPARGTLIDVRIDRVRSGARGKRDVWMGAYVGDHGKALGFVRREQYVEMMRARATPVTLTPQRGALYVITSPGTKGETDVNAALATVQSDGTLLPPRCLVVPCELYRVESIARAMRKELLPQVTARDIVLAARGGGDHLDHFEHPDVVDAFVELAKRVPTFTAIGHADDKLMLDGIVHRMFATPTAAVHELHRMLQRLRAADAPRSHARVGSDDPAGSAPHVDMPPPKAPRAEAERAAPFRSPTPRAEPLRVQGRFEEPHPEAQRPQSPESSQRAPQATGAAEHDPSAQEPRPRPRRRWAASSVDWRVALRVMGIVLLVGVGVHLIAPAPQVTTVQSASSLTAHEERERARAGRREDSMTPDSRGLDTAPSHGRKRGAPLPESRDPAARAPRAAVPAASLLAPASPIAVSRSHEAVSDAGGHEAQRTVATLIAPFDLGSDVNALRTGCAERHGIWLGGDPRCRMPGGREYHFGIASGLLQTLSVRQLGPAPVPLISGEALSSLQALAASGRGPWIVSVSPRQLTVRPRTHHPGL